MFKSVRSQRILDNIRYDYIGEFLLNKDLIFRSARRGIADIIALLYTGWLLYIFHHLFGKDRWWMVGGVAVTAFIFLHIHIWNRGGGYIGKHRKLMVQKPYQLFVIHFLIGIFLVLFQVFPRVEQFICRWF